MTRPVENDQLINFIGCISREFPAGFWPVRPHKWSRKRSRQAVLPHRAKPKTSILKAFLVAKGTDHIGWIAVFAIDRIVHTAHFVRGYFPGKAIERNPNLRVRD
jgi:hypothetical protein